MALSEFDRELMPPRRAACRWWRALTKRWARCSASAASACASAWADAGRGLIRRIGAVPNHYRWLHRQRHDGGTWTTSVDEPGGASGAAWRQPLLPSPARAADWPTTLRDGACRQPRATRSNARRQQIRALLGDARRASDILYSSAILKKPDCASTDLPGAIHVPRPRSLRELAPPRPSAPAPTLRPLRAAPGSPAAGRPVVIWNLIRRCNLTCKHCYSISADHEYAGELSTGKCSR